MTGRLLTARVVANWLNVSVETILAWQRDGTIPARKLGKVIRFDEDEIEQWLEDRRTAPRRGVVDHPSDTVRIGRLSLSLSTTEDEEN